MKLSILICTMANREKYLSRLLKQLNRQIRNKSVEVLISTLPDHCTIGHKRNRLLEDASGEYVCFIDDDDMVSNNYVIKILEAMHNSPDVITFEGWMTTDNRFTGNFVIKLGETYEKRMGVFYRFPNHLTAIKSSIAKQFKFECISHGEDYKWACALKSANALITSQHIRSKLYHYDYKSNKSKN